MAEIKIEKKGGSLWWLWTILAVLILAALAWFFLFRGNDNQSVARSTTTAVAQTTPVVKPTSTPQPVASTDATAGAITDISTVTGNRDGSLVGRDVRLSHVPVGAVVGDASFWINDVQGQKVYVVLHEVATPNTPVEGRVNVTSGSSVDIVGTLKSAKDGAPKGAAIGSKTDPIPAGINQYIYAKSAKVVS